LKKETEKFKEGDIVRVINADDITGIKINRIYVISHCKNDLPKSASVYLNITFNDPDASGGYFGYRFKKIIAGDLTPEELSSYIKYKFKIGN